MKLKEKIPWLMGRLQRTLFPCLEDCCITPLTEQDKWLVKTLELIEIENHIPKSTQFKGRPAAKRRAIARSYVAKALFRYPQVQRLSCLSLGLFSVKYLCKYFKVNFCSYSNDFLYIFSFKQG